MRRLISALSAVSIASAIAYAAAVNTTPIVTLTETGENSMGAQQPTDMSRLKLGACAVTAGGTGAQTVACNGAAGAITLPSQTFAALSATVITVNNTKAQAFTAAPVPGVPVADMVLCTVDAHAAAVASALVCSAQNNTTAGVSPGQLILTLTNPNATTATGAIVPIVYFMLATTGNPN